MSRPDMKTQVQNFARARWADFKAFTPGQKAVTVVAVLALAIGGYLLATWKSEPAYAPLYSNLAGTDASSIVSKLDEKGIPYKLTDGGAGITVPVDKVDTARLAVSAAGLPNSGQSGYSLLDKEGVTTSQFKQQVDYQRAVEGELGKTIGSIEGVQGVSVHLAIPKDDVFDDGSSRPTAAVLLTLAPATQLATSQVQGITYLVSSSVQGMKPTDVSITDSTGAVLAAPGGEVGGGVTAATQAQAEQAYNNRLSASIQSLIDSVLGAGHARVTANSQLDFSTSTTKSQKYVYDKNAPPVSEQTTKEQYSGGKPSTGGTLGTTDTAGTNSTAGGGYSKTDRTVNNALGTVTKTTQDAPGRLQKIHIAVVLDDKAKGLDVGAMESAVKNGIGFDAKRGDTLSVETVPFDTSAQDDSAAAAKKAAAAAESAKSRAELMSLAKQGALALLVALVAFATWRASRKRRPAAGAADDEDDDLIDDDPDGGARTLEPRPARANTGKPASTQRTAVLSAVDNRPADVAHVLSGWLSTKER